MTSLYGVTRYFDYQYLQQVLSKNNTPPPSEDDCSRGLQRQNDDPCSPCHLTSPSSQQPHTHVGIMGWLQRHHPEWSHLLHVAKLDYLLNNDLKPRTFFLPPSDTIQRYHLHTWEYQDLRRLLCMLIVDRPLSPAYLRRSRGYKLYTFDTYTPVFIFSPDGETFCFQNIGVEIGEDVAVPIVQRTYAGYEPASPYMYHWIHFLSDLPSIRCEKGVYAD